MRRVGLINEPAAVEEPKVNNTPEQEAPAPVSVNTEEPKKAAAKKTTKKATKK